MLFYICIQGKMQERKIYLRKPVHQERPAGGAFYNKTIFRLKSIKKTLYVKKNSWKIS